jgi:predicted nucleic acid-binding protein
MIVVADAGPLNYLVLIEEIDVLKPLYEHIIVPNKIVEELQQAWTPGAVQAWIAQPPDWLEVRPDPPSDPGLAFLDAGESAAIALAVSLQAERLLIDDWDGRAEAMRRHLLMTGTLGVLVSGIELAFGRLSETNF